MPDDEGAARHGASTDNRVGESLLRLIGLDWEVPDFSPLSRRQKTLTVNIPYRGSNGPVAPAGGQHRDQGGRRGGNGISASMAAPNAGSISTSGSMRNLEIRAAEFTISDIVHAPYSARAAGPDHARAEDRTATVTANGASDTRKCHDAIAARGAAASIPPRNNAKPRKPDTADAIARNEILRTSERVGTTILRRPRSPRPSRKSQDRSVRGKKNSGPQPICATEPRHSSDFFHWAAAAGPPSPVRARGRRQRVVNRWNWGPVR